MAAPVKMSLDYYPRTVGLRRDRKFRKGKMEFGNIFVDVYETLLDLIYEDKGYYLIYNDSTKDDVIWDVMNDLQAKYQPSCTEVGKMIEELVVSGLFSGSYFRSGILTSRRIQITYYNATVDRKVGPCIDFDIWMLSEDEMREMSGRSSILASFINRLNNEDNQSNNEDNQPDYEQKKRKEIKRNKMKENEMKENESNTENIEYIISYFKTKLGGKPGLYANHSVKRYIDMGMGLKTICNVIDRMADEGAKTWGDFERYLLHESALLWRGR